MLVYFIVVLAAVSRFIPHMSNAAPITALAIFAAAHMTKKEALGVTLAARFVSDIFLGFFAWPLMVAVYISHAAGIVFGSWIKNSQSASRRWMKIGVSGAVSSLLFFLVTNFAFLYSTYPHTWAGIAAAYANGLPFLRGTVAGDVGYTLAFFGLYEVAAILMRHRKKTLIAV